MVPVPIVPRSNHRPGEPNISLVTAIKATCEAFVDRSPPYRPLGECWETYQMFPYQRRLWSPPRLMWSATHTDKALGRLKLVHRCRNPLCVNPDHLWVPALQGPLPDDLVLPEKHTTEEQWAEYDAAFDSQPVPRPIARRTSVSRATALSEENVRWIRAEYTGNGPGSAFRLAKMFDVSVPTIMDVVHRRTWKHVSDKPKPKPHKAASPKPPLPPGMKLPKALAALFQPPAEPEAPAPVPRPEAHIPAPPTPMPVETPAEPRRLPRRLWGKVAE
jgi:hypothetical protein